LNNQGWVCYAEQKDQRGHSLYSKCEKKVLVRKVPTVERKPRSPVMEHRAKKNQQLDKKAHTQDQKRDDKKQRVE